MIGVMIIPTGIGAEIGGHAGDATPSAKLVASVCDTLIIHPNVVNAADINEMPENCLYVEGSMLDNFLEESIKLRRVKSNRILVVVNEPISIDTINSVSAARATLGANIYMVGLKSPLKLVARYDDQGMATGDVYGVKKLLEQVRKYDFDALAVQSLIDVPKEVALKYLKEGGVNPWGGAEAVCSRIISQELGLPVAHAPLESEVMVSFKEIVDPRMSPEMVSTSYLHCVLKGLHKAPQIGNGDHHGEIGAAEVDFLITPWGCVGRPHHACLELQIPIISVFENKTCLNYDKEYPFERVENYLEAVGFIKALDIGVTRESVCRPIKRTEILAGEIEK